MIAGRSGIQWALAELGPGIPVPPGFRFHFVVSRGLPWDPSSLAGPSCTRIGAVTRKTRLARGLRRYPPKQKELILEGGKGGVETNYRFLLRDVMELLSSVILDTQAIDCISFILSNCCLN